jgi:diguanylate cyclase (GGDEF)-like protein/putative nucleotidyltransferase with HDIG domain
MFQVSSSNIIQISCLLVSIVLIAFTLYSKQMKLKKLFLLYLTAVAVMSLAGFLMNQLFSYELLLVWKMTVIVFSAWAVVAYTHFITAYLGQKTSKVTKLGYGWVGFTFFAAAFGYFAQGATFVNDPLLTTYYGYVLNALSIANGFFLIAMAIFLVKSIASAVDPEERNRTGYLLAGLVVMFAAGVLGYVFKGYHYALPGIGMAVNGLIITYSLLKYRLLDIQKLLKKWMTYTVVTVCVTLAYLALILLLSKMLRALPPQFGIPLTIVMVIFFAYLFNWLKATLDKAADRLFYGSRYQHRKMLLDFANKTSTFINIEDIANELLGPLVKVIGAREVDLLLPANDQLSTKFVARLNEEDPIVPLNLPQSSSFVKWLETQGTLSRSNIENAPEFKDLNPEQINLIDTTKFELLCPIISKRMLVGVLALGPKQGRRHFTRDDIDLVATLAKESAVAIENAQMYARAREKADTDELTGLRNHRCFQERLNQSIEKFRLSGGDFSMLFIDLDFFKTYNDIYGHMMGDEILREVGQLITSSVRATDVGARYGGDEFAALLLYTSPEGAEMVAERIREGLQSSMEQRGIMLTCSIGVASWRIDGITRESLVQAADKALYAAKTAGRNRVYLASRLKATENTETDRAFKTDDKNAIDSIVYALAATVDTRDHYTFGHSKSVSKYATELAAAVGYTKDGIKRIRAAALLHDIGKLSIPDNILSKAGPLSDREWEIMKQHPETGVGILKYIVGLRGCVDAVLYHHERYDGQGYPRGLKENDIPLDARIMTIADSFDAMTSERSYKERRLTPEEAMAEMTRCAGAQFDPKLVEIFIGLRQKAANLLSTLDKAEL